MITEDFFYGGAEFHNVTVDINLYSNSPRVQRLNVTVAGKHVILPPTAGLQPGGPYFYVMNTGTQSITVDSGTPVTLAVGQVASIWLKYNAGVPVWLAFVKSFNAGSLAHVGTRSNPSDFEVDAPKTYSPDCSDACDGALGFATPRFPMWMNSCTALNTLRDPIRGADIGIPTKVEIKVTDGLIYDSNHPNGTAPSSQLLASLRATHVLDYDTSLSWGTTSRNPYHIGLELDSPTPTWVHPGTGGVTVTRYVWRKLINYTVGQIPYVIEIRFVAEYSTDPDTGVWGSIFYVAAFSTECRNAYVDGTNDASQNNAPFTHNDPFVYGPLYAGANTHKKFFHPQMLFLAMVPTTFHAPCGDDHIPAGEELWSECYHFASNGAPWSGNDPLTAWKNCVFARPSTDPTGYTLARAMTIGGSVPTSELYPFMCIENVEGYGGTWLKPTNAGWDEEAGSLGITSDLVFTECPTSQASSMVDICFGHPSDNYGGGTHVCFKTSHHAEYCCLPTNGTARAIITEVCCSFPDPQGPFNSGSGLCDTYSGPAIPTCSLLYTYTTDIQMQLEDYVFSILAPEDRYMSWVYFAADPRYVPFVFDMATTYADVTASTGSWTIGSTSFVCTAVSGSGTVSGVARWTGTSFVCGHVRVTALAKISVANVPHGISVADDGTDRIIGITNPGAGTVTLYLYKSSVYYILDQVSGLTITGDQALELTREGSTVTYKSGSTTLTGNTCGLVYVGTVGFVTGGATTGARFENVTIEDRNAYYPNSGAAVTWSGGDGFVMQKIRLVLTAGVVDQYMQLFKNPVIQQKAILSTCSDGVNLDCGTPPYCDCMKTTYGDCTSDSTLTSPSSTDLDHVNPVGGGPPTTLPPNDGCPPEFRDAVVELPPSCKPSPWRFAGGAEWWWGGSSDVSEA